MTNIPLFLNTVRYLKTEQIWYQLIKRAGMTCSIIKNHKFELDLNYIRIIPAIRELDYDDDFLSRFSVEELLHDEVELLHEREKLCLNGSWYFEDRSPLWNHNLHYFEYLFALAKRYEACKNKVYFIKIKQFISSWIKYNPIGIKNSAWECYPIALRIQNWIDIYSILQEEIEQDKEFRGYFIESIFEQYMYLSNHLEKHLMANHYFEDLKALVIAAVFLGDKAVQEKATEDLLRQCKEQIFEDGMHFERSPMYQKILLEDLMRVEVALECSGKESKEIKKYISKMLDAAYSLEHGIDRLPLFNDCGKNVAKSLGALTSVAKKYFCIEPKMRFSFPESGFYIYEFGEKKEWRLLIDAGQPGPDYSPGHAHCELMSYELFHNGEPMFVNSGTYAYQCSERLYYKSTEAHNTVRVSEIEQSECWSNFRMARRARIKCIQQDEHGMVITMTDYLGHSIKRSYAIKYDSLEICDESLGSNLDSYVHFATGDDVEKIRITKGKSKNISALYSEEFGLKREIQAIKISGTDSVRYVIKL